MKPLIGVILRNGVSSSGRDIYVLYKGISLAILNSGGVPLGIVNNAINEYMDICDGFILEGGDDIDLDNLKCLETLYKKNKPVLGICLGMQEMGYLFNGSISDIEGHMDTYHDVIINRDSLLYKIIGKDKINVNSRHKSYVNSTSLMVCARTLDGTIEAISEDDKKFFLGVQWHPESMYFSDVDAKKIFDYFVKICNDY